MSANIELKRVLLESTLAEIKAIEELDYSFVKADEAFKARIKQDMRTFSSFKPRRFFLILAATLTICFCIALSVSADMRNGIIDFFVRTYDSFSEIFFERGEEIAPDTIEVEYQPSYFKENGYERVYYKKYNSMICTRWARNSQEVSLLQKTIGNGNPSVDTENADCNTTYVGDLKVIYTYKYATYNVYWVQNGYYFSLQCHSSMSWSDVEKIILSTAIVE